MAKLQDIIKSLEDTFFGEDYQRYLSLVNNLVACRSLKDFRHLKIDFRSVEVDNVYSNNIPQPAAKESMTQERAEHIFTNMKAVQANAQFI